VRYDEIHIGNHAFGDKTEGNEAKVILKDAIRKQHCHIIGGTGTGKSKLMEYMIRQDIRNGNGVCLIDPHGSLYEAVLKWTVLHGFGHRLLIIDPNEKEWSVGLNLLEFDPDLFDVGQHVENVIHEIGKARDENLFSTAQLIIWMRNFFQLAALSGLTLMEIYHLLNEHNVELRQALTDNIEKEDKELARYFREAWNEYDNSPVRTRSEMMKLPVWARVQTFRGTRAMRHIVGQAETTIDFYKAMGKGRIVLVNLHGKISENERTLIGIMVIDKIFQAAMRRRPERGKLFYVYIDEFGNFVSERIAKALEELRKRNVPFVLAHQELEQLKKDESRQVGGNRLLAAINSNAKVKIAFRISREDAEAMALEMFGGFIHGDEKKFEQMVTSFWPHLTTAKSHAHGSAETRGETDSIMDSFGQMMSHATGHTYMPGTGFVDMGSFSMTSGMGDNSMSGSSRGMIKSYTKSEAEIEFPFYEQEPFEQVVSTSFYSIEEMKERYIAFLQNQEERFFHLRILGETTKPPIPLITPTVKEVHLLPSMYRNARLKGVIRCGTPVAEIEEEWEERREMLLELQNGREVEDDDLTYGQYEYEPRNEG